MPAARAKADQVLARWGRSAVRIAATSGSCAPTVWLLFHRFMTPHQMHSWSGGAEQIAAAGDASVPVVALAQPWDAAYTSALTVAAASGGSSDGGYTC
jgi:hypothetical protein